jgi:hypothetical protein
MPPRKEHDKVDPALILLNNVVHETQPTRRLQGLNYPVQVSKQPVKEGNRRAKETGTSGENGSRFRTPENSACKVIHESLATMCYIVQP